MDALQRLFGAMLKDLAPGIRDPGKVIRDRLIYRSAEQQAAAKQKPVKAGSMAIDDLQHSVMPVEETGPKAEARDRQDLFRLPGFSKQEMAVDLAPKNKTASKGGSVIE